MVKNYLKLIHHSIHSFTDPFIHTDVHKFFQKCRGHVKILATTSAKRSNFHTEDP